MDRVLLPVLWVGLGQEMLNLQPAGQIWPVKASNPARERIFRAIFEIKEFALYAILSPKQVPSYK